jgi:hypothetical protein
MEKIIHPTLTEYELHFLPHVRAYDTNSNSYLPITEKNTISIAVKSTRKLNFDKFVLECKLKRKLNPNEVVTYIDGNSNNHMISNLDVKVKEPTNDIKNILVKDEQNSKIYKSISRLAKDTGVSIALIKACCNDVIHEAKGKGDKWYNFSWSDEVDIDISKLQIV